MVVCVTEFIIIIFVDQTYKILQKNIVKWYALSLLSSTDAVKDADEILTSLREDDEIDSAHKLPKQVAFVFPSTFPVC